MGSGRVCLTPHSASARHMELDDGIAVEDVHVIFELDAFLPTATPRGASRVESETGPVSAQDGSLDAVLGHRVSARGSGELCEQSAGVSCVPEVVGRVGEDPVVRSPQHQSPLEMKRNMLRGVRADVMAARRSAATLPCARWVPRTHPERLPRTQ